MKAFGHSLRSLNSCKLTIAAAVSVLIWMFFVACSITCPAAPMQ
jgi:hypothetical protein